MPFNQDNQSSAGQFSKRRPLREPHMSQAPKPTSKKPRIVAVWHARPHTHHLLCLLLEDPLHNRVKIPLMEGFGKWEPAPCRVLLIQQRCERDLGFCCHSGQEHRVMLLTVFASSATTAHAASTLTCNLSRKLKTASRACSIYPTQRCQLHERNVSEGLS